MWRSGGLTRFPADPIPFITATSVVLGPLAGVVPHKVRFRLFTTTYGNFA